MKLSLSKIAELTGGAGEFDPNAIATGYSIDSRTIRSGELFFAVKGEKMDGHDFVAQAIEKGAVAAVVAGERVSSEEWRAKPPASQTKLMVVEDTLGALQLLAQGVRKLWGRPLVCVTGSAGKTTTKEAIAQVLSSKFRVHKSEGNFNNHFGLPLMLLKLQPEHDIAVVELGMSHLGEITALARIARPNTGVVTNVAPVHLEFFNSIAEIARAKRELIESLPPEGAAVLNGDDEYVSKFGQNFKGKVVTYGFSATCAVRAENWSSAGEAGSAFDVALDGLRARITLPLMGKHNVYNALAAIAVGLENGVGLEDSARALEKLSPADKRGQVVRIGNITLINDCYNSNPKALAAMVDALAEMPAKRRIVVAGEMLELGPEGEQMHRDSGRHMAEKGIHVVIGVRGLAKLMSEGAKKAGVAAEFFETPEEAGEWLAREARDGDVVLLKASRGVKLERAMEKLQPSAVSHQPSGKT